MLKKMKLSSKMLLLTGSIVVLALAVITITAYSKAGGMMRDAARKEAENLAYRYGNEVRSDLNMVLDSARSMQHVFLKYKQWRVEDRRAHVSDVLHSVMEQSPEFLGTWAVWEPNALDGRDAENAGKPGADAKGRYAPYWNRVGGLHIETCVDYDKSGPTAEFYQRPKRTGEETVLEPVIYPINNVEVMVVSFCVPIKVEGDVVGVVGVDISMDRIREIIAKVKPYETGYAFLCANDGTLAAHPKKEYLGKLVGEEDKHPEKEKIRSSIKGGQTLFLAEESMEDGSPAYVVYVPITIGKAKTQWSFAVVLPLDKVLAGTREIRNYLVLIGFVTTILVLIIIFVIVRNVIQAIQSVVAMLKDIAHGEGDLTQRLAVDRQDELGEMASCFNTFMEKLHEMIVKVKDRTDEVANATQEIAAGSNDLANRTNEQAASITETSATLEQLTANIRQNSGNAEEASTALRSFNQGFQSKMELINNVTHTMTEIDQSGQKINNIINVINDISFQTNLLALNAAVEAARAGEAGRGFAVVAAEVRNLAQKTSESSKTIQEIVHSNLESTQKGMQLVNQTADFFSSIVKVLQEIVHKMEAIANGSKEQAAGVEQINTAIAQLENVISQNAALVEEFSATGRNLKSNSDDLREMVEHFKV